MAQGGIKKGFFFYFGLFVLLLISIFCICLVIMMFNPGKTVLWMQYFTANSTFQVVKTNDDLKQAINWKDVHDVEISCDYADVVIERNSNSAIEKYCVDPAQKDGIYIVNQAKGFAAASSAQPFSYNAYFEGGKLKIEIKEPTGFLYFSKEIKVILHATTTKTHTNAADWNFGGINLEVKTGEGDIFIGGQNIEKPEEVKLASLNAETKSGNISISELFDTTSLSTLNIKTENGTLDSSRKIKYSGDDEAKGLALNCDATFDVEGSGKIKFEAINAPQHTITLTCKSGAWDIKYLNASKIECPNCKNGNYFFGSVYGDLKVNSTDSLISPNIKIEYLDGNFSLDAKEYGDSKPEVEIDEAKKQVEMLVDKGSLKIKKAHGLVIAESNADLNVDVTFCADASGYAKISNKNGDIRLAFVDNVFENTANQGVGVYVATDKGDVVIDVTDKARFTAEMFKNVDGDDKPKIEDEKIKVNIGNDMIDGNTKNPLKVNQHTSAKEGTMQILSNGNVSFNLKAKNELISNE